MTRTHGNTSCTPSLQGRYPTKTEVASNSTLKRTATATYDPYTGVVKTTTDVDNGVTNAMEYDDIGRPTKAITAQGAAGFESWTQTEYHDPDPAPSGDKRRYIVVRSDLETVGDGKKVAIQHYDQLGRVRLSRSLENAATEDPYNETHGIKVETRYKATGYACPWDDQQGAQETCSAQLVSNPYRADYSYNAGSEPTMGATYDANGNVLTATDANGITITNTYDALNRPLTRTYSDGTPAVTSIYDDPQVPYSKGKFNASNSSDQTMVKSKAGIEPLRPNVPMRESWYRPDAKVRFYRPVAPKKKEEK